MRVAVEHLGRHPALALGERMARRGREEERIPAERLVRKAAQIGLERENRAVDRTVLDLIHQPGRPLLAPFD